MASISSSAKFASRDSLVRKLALFTTKLTLVTLIFGLGVLMNTPIHAFFAITFATLVGLSLVGAFLAFAVFCDSMRAARARHA